MDLYESFDNEAQGEKNQAKKSLYWQKILMKNTDFKN